MAIPETIVTTTLSTEQNPITVDADTSTMPTDDKSEGDVSAPKAPFDQYWKPDDWQFSASTDFLSADISAGFFRDGLDVSGVELNDDGTYSVGVTGFSTVNTKPGIDLETYFVRKEPRFEVLSKNEGGIPQLRVKPGAFASKGPGFGVNFGYRPMQFTDHGWGLSFEGDELHRVLSEAANGTADQFDTDIPSLDLTNISQYEQDLEDWLNSNESGVRGIPNIVEQAFRGYNLGDDFDTGSNSGDAYTVHMLSLGTQFCFDTTVWDYSKRVNVFNGGRLCLDGAVNAFIEPDFNSHMYLGGGPSAEFSLLTYNHRPFRTVESYGMNPQTEFVPPKFSSNVFLFSGIHYYHGFGLKDGFSEGDFYIDGGVGLGARVTIPSLKKSRVQGSSIPEKDAKKTQLDFEAISSLFEDEPILVDMGF